MHNVLTLLPLSDYFFCDAFLGLQVSRTWADSSQAMQPMAWLRALALCVEVLVEVSEWRAMSCSRLWISLRMCTALEGFIQGTHFSVVLSLCLRTHEFHTSALSRSSWTCVWPSCVPDWVSRSRSWISSLSSMSSGFLQGVASFSSFFVRSCLQTWWWVYNGV